MDRCHTIDISHYGAVAGSQQDATSNIALALAACREKGNCRLIFHSGRYDFWPDLAAERYLFISNNTEGLKRIAFPLFDLEDIEIDGQGSEFRFHGFIVPFVIFNSCRVRLTNFSIDWERPFHSEALIKEVEPEGVLLEFIDEFPYVIRGDRLYFKGESNEDFGFNNVVEFDSARKETAFQTFDNFSIADNYSAYEAGPGLVFLKTCLTSPPTKGNTLVFGADHRQCPAIAIQNSSAVEVADVTIYHSGGMGIIGQLTNDLSLKNILVAPPLNGKRILSATADALHFVNCGGKITVEDCRFENQLDDAINAHGIYAQIVERPSPRRLDIAFNHREQQGIDIFAAGAMVELVRSKTLETYHIGTVLSVTRVNKQRTILYFADDLPTSITAGDVVGNLTTTTDLQVRRCVSRNNRARGFLISVAGHVEIEDNTFHTPGSAILVAGDANYWFESGPVRDLVIRNNHFDNCNYGVWGKACIDIDPELRSPDEVCPVYHKNIIIEDNIFDIFHPLVVAANSVAGLHINGNTLRNSSSYTYQGPETTTFKIDNCRDVSEFGNTTIEL